MQSGTRPRPRFLLAILLHAILFINVIMLPGILLHAILIINVIMLPGIDCDY